MKVFFRRIHLYLSLAAGLVILVCCLTGAILVFEKEIQMEFNQHRYYVTAGTQTLPATYLVQKVKDSFPKAKINGIKFYAAADRSVEINISLPAAKDAGKPAVNTPPVKPGAKPAPPQRQPGYTIFINPYTGQILEKYSYRETWLFTVFALHRWLLGGDDSVGKYIVGVSTFIFLFILITGIILWWPKTKRILQQRLKVKWDAGWKRLNHDLHIVLGFYSAIFLFIFAFTGLAWSFEWMNNSIYALTNSPLKPPPPPKSVYIADAKKISVDTALQVAKSQRSNGVLYNLSFPKDSTEAFSVSVLPANAVHESATDAVYIDQYSGKLLAVQTYQQRSLGARVRSTFKPVHTGSIWGTPSKIIAFVVCVLGVTFPVTGIIMWINRTRKKKRNGGGEEEDANS